MTKAKVIFHHAWTSGLIGAGTVLLGYLSQATEIHDVNALRAFSFTVGGAIIAAFFSGVRAALITDIPQLEPTDPTQPTE